MCFRDGISERLHGTIETHFLLASSSRMSLNKEADELRAKYLQQFTQTARDEYIAFQIDFLERMLVTKGLSTNDIHLEPEYKPSYEKLLELYRRKELDGTKTTFICKGTVVDIKNPRELPPYTIRDGPPSKMFHSHQYGAMDPEGFPRA